MLYGSDTKFRYTAAQWIQVESVKKGDHIHQKMCGHGGKRMMKVWVLDGKDKKTLACF